jgi:hypothetical protein
LKRSAHCGSIRSRKSTIPVSSFLIATPKNSTERVDLADRRACKRPRRRQAAPELAPFQMIELPSPALASMAAQQIGERQVSALPQCNISPGPMTAMGSSAEVTARHDEVCFRNRTSVYDSVSACRTLRLVSLSRLHTSHGCRVAPDAAREQRSGFFRLRISPAEPCPRLTRVPTLNSGVGDWVSSKKPPLEVFPPLASPRVILLLWRARVLFDVWRSRALKRLLQN